MDYTEQIKQMNEDSGINEKIEAERIQNNVHNEKIVITIPEKILTQNMRLSGVVILALFGIIFLLLGIGALYVNFTRLYDIYRLVAGIVFLIISFLLFYFSFTKLYCLSIDKAGVSLYSILRTSHYPYSEIESLYLTFKTDTSTWAFNEYSGIRINTISGASKFVPVEMTEALKVNGIYLRDSPGAVNKEYNQIHMDVEILNKSIKHQKIALKYCLLVTVILSTIVSILAIPDTNIHGEPQSQLNKVILGVVGGLMLAGFIAFVYFIYYGSQNKDRMKEFNWRMAQINAITQNKIKFTEAELAQIHRRSTSSLRYAGVGIIIMGILSIAIGIGTLITGDFTPQSFMMLIISPAFLGLGIKIYYQGR